MEPSVMTVADYVAIVQRRKWSLILPVVLVFAAAAAVALLLPPVYKSTATILIEEQEIPSEYVKATVTSYAEQRLQSINQRVMSSNRLLEIINRFDLYADMRDRWSTEEIVAKMREDTKLEPISAEVMDRRSGRPAEATIAFTLSYEGKAAPQKVQQVANVLTSLILDENLQVRARQTRETSEFLEGEMNRVKVALDDLEGRISAFKEKNINRAARAVAGEHSEPEQHRAHHRAAAGAAAQPEGARGVSADAAGQRVALSRGEAEGQAAGWGSSRSSCII